jgi:hypothetical protein
VSLIAWSVAAVLVMWAAVSDAPAVAFDAVWLFAASAFLSTASLLVAMMPGSETAEEAGPALRPNTSVETDRVFD